MLEPLAGRLHEVTVRPTVGTSERNRWDALMGAHHYLAFRGLVGRSVRHVAVLGEHWLALIGWHAGAFKLKARDRWIGWLPEQQFRHRTSQTGLWPKARALKARARLTLWMSSRVSSAAWLRSG